VPELATDSVANRVQNEHKIAWRSNLAQQRHPREHLHLFERNVVQATNLLVALELLPGGKNLGVSPWVKKGLSTRIGQEEQFAPVQAENVCESAYNLVRRMPLKGLQMADVRGGGFDTPGDLLLRKIELSATLAN
jgi:hypothetical protein